jgi:ribonuclease P protein component
MPVISDNYTFRKEEKLCSAKAIDTLFSAGESFIAYPLRIVYLLHDEPDMDNRYASVLISVSKKKFKRAVRRNRVKRLIREVFRLNKFAYIDLLRKHNKRMEIAFLYLKDELPEYAEIEKSIMKSIVLLTDKAGAK